MTHLDQITKQATEALNAYAAKAGVPADKIPALAITQDGARYRIKTPGARVAKAIADAIEIDGMDAYPSTGFVVVVHPEVAEVEQAETLETYMLRNGFDRNDI